MNEVCMCGVCGVDLESTVHRQRGRHLELLLHTNAANPSGGPIPRPVGPKKKALPRSLDTDAKKRGLAQCRRDVVVRGRSIPLHTKYLSTYLPT